MVDCSAQYVHIRYHDEWSISLPEVKPYLDFPYETAQNCFAELSTLIVSLHKLLYDMDQAM